MSYPNPYPVTLAGRNSFRFSAVANASYFQRVTMSFSGGDDDAGVVFNGRGEGVAMTTADGKTSYLIPQVTTQVTCTLLFQYSTDGTKFVNANVVSVSNSGTSPDPQTLTIGTEDAQDGDNNDTLLTLVTTQIEG